MTSPSSCPFCKIAATYQPSKNAVPDNPDPELISPNCHLILSTDVVMAFLDIMPITAGHVLVIPRPHREKLMDLRGNEGAALGMWLPVVSRAVMRALGRDGGDWNIVQNNGATAAQVVPHTHYHIIPRGGDNVPEIKARSWTMFGRGSREDLDDAEGQKLAASIRAEVEEDLRAMSQTDVEGRRLLGRL